MNIKKLFGLLACAAVSAVAFNAYANTNADWFGASASGTTLDLDSATTNGASITVSDNKITIDNDYDTLLAVAPTTQSPVRSDGLVTITSTAVLTPCAFADLPTDFDEGKPQVGFAVVTEDNSKYYYYTYVGSTPAWGNTGAEVTDIDQETTFTIVLDYRTNKATFKVDDKVVTNDVAFAGASLTDVAAFGYGTITSIDADYEVAVCAVGDTKYGSVADAIAAGSSASDIAYVDSSGTKGSTTAANGMSAAVCLAVGLDATDANAVLRAVPVESDTDAGNVTLKIATAAESGVTYTVKNASDETVSTSTEASAIMIPTATGIYTITPSLEN